MSKHRKSDPKMIADGAYDLLRRKAEDAIDAMCGFQFPEGRFDNDAVFALFVKMTCPVVCNGVITKGNNWHKVCETKARDAMRALEIKPPPESDPPLDDEDDWDF